MSRTFFSRIHQQRRAADAGQIARVEREGGAITIGVNAIALVFPLIIVPLAPVAAPSLNDIAVDVIAPESPVIGVAVAVELLVDVSASISPVATPSVNDIAVDVIAPQSPTIGVVAIIVSVT